MKMSVKIKNIFFKLGDLTRIDFAHMYLHQ